MSSYSKEEAGSIRELFANIAERYDLINRLMTFGQDKAWRRIAVSKLGLGTGKMAIDIGCGTGDFAFELLKQYPKVKVFGCDFTWEMIQVARLTKGSEKIDWILADAQQLPFKRKCFDACVSGFLMRNVPMIKKALAEQYRVLKTKGDFVSLDTSPPTKDILKPFKELYFRFVIPFLGTIITGDRAAYRYLPQSTKRFLDAQALTEEIELSGFSKCSYQKLMFASVAIHRGQKS